MTNKPLRCRTGARLYWGKQ